MPAGSANRATLLRHNNCRLPNAWHCIRIGQRFYSLDKSRLSSRSVIASGDATCKSSLEIQLEMQHAELTCMLRRFCFARPALVQFCVDFKHVAPMCLRSVVCSSDLCLQFSFVHNRRVFHGMQIAASCADILAYPERLVFSESTEAPP